MAKIEVKIGYTKKVGDFDFLRADVGISDIDTDIPLDSQLAPAKEYLATLWDMAKEDINTQFKQQVENLSK